MVDGELVLAVATEHDFREAMKTGLPIEAGTELGGKFGFPVDGEDVGTLDDIQGGHAGAADAYLMPGDGAG